MQEPETPSRIGLKQVPLNPQSPKETIDLTLFRLTQWLYPLLIKQKNIQALEFVRKSLPLITSLVSNYEELQIPFFQESFDSLCKFLNRPDLISFISAPAQDNIPADYGEIMWDFSNVIGQIYDFLQKNRHPYPNPHQSNQILDNTPQLYKATRFAKEEEDKIIISKLKIGYDSLRKLYLVLKDEVLAAAGFKLSGSKNLNRGERVW
jgi:uncharacterized protein YozE (UPF0346 family)